MFVKLQETWRELDDALLSHSPSESLVTSLVTRYRLLLPSVVIYFGYRVYLGPQSRLRAVAGLIRNLWIVGRSAAD